MDNEDMYLNVVAKETGRLFAYWSYKQLDMEYMIDMYMTSDLRKNIDQRFVYYCTLLYSAQVKEFEDREIQGGFTNGLICKWVGNCYTYLQSRTSIPSARLIEILPFRDIYVEANRLCELSMPTAVNELERLIICRLMNDNFVTHDLKGIYDRLSSFDSDLRSQCEKLSIIEGKLNILSSKAAKVNMLLAGVSKKGFIDKDIPAMLIDSRTRAARRSAKGKKNRKKGICGGV